MGLTSRQAAIIGIALLVHGGVGFGVYFFLEQQGKPSAVRSDDAESEASSDERAFHSAQTELYQVPTADWTDDDVARVYVVLDYARAQGAHRLALNWLNELDLAAKQGVDIDQAEHDGTYRDTLRREASEALREAEAAPSAGAAR
ncbi:hypothetical protein [Agromyces mariniharenae]|uniref:Uncharacterized protein n=1 Tax=Agromyces mariniharenae TaxID=2604423 RepID=A0A5S4UWD0_9MICO|nr:hypothetical protein [Agromyces mariniharenae]TYL51187.1 hypothetical protein FYC51_18905 [Agromyces mariniharenae]